MFPFYFEGVTGTAKKKKEIKKFSSARVTERQNQRVTVLVAKWRQAWLLPAPVVKAPGGFWHDRSMFLQVPTTCRMHTTTHRSGQRIYCRWMRSSCTSRRFCRIPAVHLPSAPKRVSDLRGRSSHHGGLRSVVRRSRCASDHSVSASSCDASRRPLAAEDWQAHECKPRMAVPFILEFFSC